MILDTASVARVDFGASGLDEIAQNLRTIVTTATGTCPLFREFGVDFGFVDQPTPVALARFKASVLAAVRKYEPRVEITKVELVADERAGQAGKLKTVLHFEVTNEF